MVHLVTLDYLFQGCNFLIPARLVSMMIYNIFIQLCISLWLNLFYTSVQIRKCSVICSDVFQCSVKFKEKVIKLNDCLLLILYVLYISYFKSTCYRRYFYDKTMNMLSEMFGGKRVTSSSLSWRPKAGTQMIAITMLT